MTEQMPYVWDEYTITEALDKRYVQAHLTGQAPRVSINYILDADNEHSLVTVIPALLKRADTVRENAIRRDMLVQIAKIAQKEHQAAYRSGFKAGKAAQIKMVHELLGMDKLDRLADALEEFLGRQ